MKNTILSFLLLLFSLIGFSQENEGEQEQIKNKQRVSYIYNFTKYIDWEDLDNQTEFVIGILGENNNALFDEFIEVAKLKTIKDLPVVIKQFNAPEEITATNILYLNKKDNYDLNPILEQLYFNHSLLVTEGYPFHMSMINFIEIDDEFHFEISKEKINRAKLLVDPALLSFSIQSTADWNLLYDRLKEEIETVQTQQVELEKLNDEISVQKEEITNQENQLKATLTEIEVQNLLLEDQQKIMSSQKSDIQNQLRRLEKLSEEINDKENINNDLIETFEQQQRDIADQKKELEEQYNTLETQKSEILKQEDEIRKQEDTLKIKIGEIKQQRITLYVFLAFLIFAIIFIIFMYRANKRRKESERKLNMRNNELIALNKSLDSFTYRVSHDLKAPVINVQNMISMLEELTEEDVNPIIPDVFKNLKLSTNRLENTIVDMLELTRIERIEETKAQIHLKPIVDELIPEYTEELSTIKGQILNEIDPNTTVFGSDIELKSVIQNMITNSIKYRDENRPLKIKVSTKTNDTICTLTYTDNGPGIDLKKFEGKLFNMFERFSSDNTIEGTGVGMYIIKKLVETNNGKVKLESTLGEGLTYIITLPNKSE